MAHLGCHTTLREGAAAIIPLQSSLVKTKPKTEPDTPYQAARALRKTLPPANIAMWNPKLRKKSVATLLKASLVDRLPSLTKIRYERMAVGPFGFFRGSACVMAYDLSLTPHTGIEAQLCGDGHVQNLGAFEGQDGHLIFDINDFDETLRGPFEYDIKRMATSILLAGRGARIKPVATNAAAQQFLTSYVALTKTLLPMPVLAIARYQVHRLGSVDAISKILAQAERATPQLTLDKLTSAYPKGRIFKTEPPLLSRIEDKAERAAILASLKPYLASLQPERQRFFSRFTPIDLAFKVVGTGSVGLRDYIVYMEGNDPGSGTDPLFLQIKQEAASCYAPYLPHDKKINQGHRVVDGQRAMQIQSDPLLGWTRVNFPKASHDYLVRQLNDHKASIDLTALKANDLCQYAAVCGEILARGHARSGDVRQIAGYLGNGKRFSKAILDYAQTYATQMEKDWKAFVPQGKNAKRPKSHAAATAQS